MKDIITKEVFLERISNLNTTYKIIGEFKGANTKILVEDKFGVCNMLPSNLFQNKKPNIKSAVDRKKYFINQVKEVHGDLYEYNKFVYIKSRNLSTITCKIHGDFQQTPNNHLRGKGCLKCALQISGHGKDKFILKSKGRECIFYKIKCFNEKEEFYKIGITSNKMEVRFHSTKLPYSYEIISEVKGEAGEIWDMELEAKRELKDFKYTPLIKFSGATECFIKLS